MKTVKQGGLKMIATLGSSMDAFCQFICFNQVSQFGGETYQYIIIVYLNVNFCLMFDHLQPNRIYRMALHVVVRGTIWIFRAKYTLIEWTVLFMFVHGQPIAHFYTHRNVGFRDWFKEKFFFKGQITHSSWRMVDEAAQRLTEEEHRRDIPSFLHSTSLCH